MHLSIVVKLAPEQSEGDNSRRVMGHSHAQKGPLEANGILLLQE